MGTLWRGGGRYLFLFVFAIAPLMPPKSACAHRNIQRRVSKVWHTAAGWRIFTISERGPQPPSFPCVSVVGWTKWTPSLPLVTSTALTKTFIQLLKKYSPACFWSMIFKLKKQQPTTTRITFSKSYLKFSTYKSHQSNFVLMEVVGSAGGSGSSLPFHGPPPPPRTPFSKPRSDVHRKLLFCLYKVTLRSFFLGMIISSCWFIHISIMLMSLIFSRTATYIIYFSQEGQEKDELTWSPQL